MTLALLLAHVLAGAALLGALTHQCVAAWRNAPRTAAAQASFLGRYGAVGARGFTVAVVVLYVLVTVPGGLIYPVYRLDVRIPFEEMGLWWAVGLFEIKEHWGGIGLGLLPLYASLWLAPQLAEHRRDRLVMTVLLTLVAWFDFVAGHVLNNLRGLP
jgi:hypothetical protein